MKFMKITVTMLLSIAMFSSCHMGKKYAYIKKFHKEAKDEVGNAKVKFKGDTVRIVYPEVAMFDFNKDEIKPEAKISLSRFGSVLKKYDRINFIINGYTDNVGTDEVNNALSEKRANSAKTLFENNGVSSSRMQTHGMGSSNPVETNTTDEGRAANRRVELLLYERK